MLAFFRNDMGLGGNNGMTDFKDILGFSVQSDATRAALCFASALVLAIFLVIAGAVVGSRFGKALTAVRDAESRMRFLGYRVEGYKLFVFVLSAAMAGVAGALYVPQVGIINPSEFSPGNSIEAVLWVAVGGRGTLIGPVIGAFVVNFGKTYLTGALPEVWLFALGALFIAVTLFLPKGIVGLWAQIRSRARDAQGEGPGMSTSGMSMTEQQEHLGAALSQRRHRLVRRLQGAEQPVAAGRAGRDAGHHRPQRRRQDHHDGRHHRQDAARRGRGRVRRQGRPHQARRGRHRRPWASGGSSRSPPCSRTTRCATTSCWRWPACAAGTSCCSRRRPRPRTSAWTRSCRSSAWKPQQHMLAARLSHGQKQWLEIGMLLAQDPKLLLVDEPVAGMTDVETETTAQVLREINKTHSVVVVEHDMSFVRALGVKVTVLHEGSMLAEGSLDQVSADPRVVEVYLGR